MTGSYLDFGDIEGKGDVSNPRICAGTQSAKLPTPTRRIPAGTRPGGNELLITPILAQTAQSHREIRHGNVVAESNPRASIPSLERRGAGSWPSGTALACGRARNSCANDRGNCRLTAGYATQKCPSAAASHKRWPRHRVLRLRTIPRYVKDPRAENGLRDCSISLMIS